MSLYYEASDIIAKSIRSQTFLKRAIYDNKNIKSPPASLFALVSEATKWSDVLSDVVERSELLCAERKLAPALALVLAHDLLLAKKGIAAPKNHELTKLIQRHKTRLDGEFTKYRVRHRFATLEHLRRHVENAALAASRPPVVDCPSDCIRPRWIRINTLRSSLDEALASTFKDYDRVDGLQKLQPGSTTVFVDKHIPNLVAVPQTADLSKDPAYLQGKIIFQDKASCFPAYLLNPSSKDTHIIDACAAPGNKTTHLAAILSENGKTTNVKIIACEKDKSRAETLQKMVDKANAASMVSVLAKQDFLALDPFAAEFADVTALLLDPSCSGSGIVGRDDENQSGEQAEVVIQLPSREPCKLSKEGSQKRRRGGIADSLKPTAAAQKESKQADEITISSEALTDRLDKLASFQIKLLKHAFRFPAALRVTYSTCSIHAAENEEVVVRALRSKEAREGGWRILQRSEQVQGMRDWPVRGDFHVSMTEMRTMPGAVVPIKSQNLAESCVRCQKGTELGTMGFFVAAFVRDHDHKANINRSSDQVDEREGKGENKKEHPKERKGTTQKEETNGPKRKHEDVSEDDWNGCDD